MADAGSGAPAVPDRARGPAAGTASIGVAVPGGPAAGRRAADPAPGVPDGPDCGTGDAPGVAAAGSSAGPGLQEGHRRGPIPVTADRPGDRDPADSTDPDARDGPGRADRGDRHDPRRPGASGGRGAGDGPGRVDRDERSDPRRPRRESEPARDRRRRRSAFADPPVPGDGGGEPPARNPRPVRRWAVRLVAGAVLMLAFVVGATAFRVWEVARLDDRRPVDAVVVLGAAQYDGDPSSIFAARLRHAAALYHEGIAPRIVTTGGGRTGDLYTEAAAGKRYLVGQGVPASAVVAVGVGTDTLGSLRAVAARAEADGWVTALLVSDPWHSLRARQMARDSGLVAWTSPTRTGPVVQTRETQVRYIVRETAAMLYYRFTHTSVDTETTGVG